MKHSPEPYGILSLRIILQTCLLFADGLCSNKTIHTPGLGYAIRVCLRYWAELIPGWNVHVHVLTYPISEKMWHKISPGSDLSNLPVLSWIMDISVKYLYTFQNSKCSAPLCSFLGLEMNVFLQPPRWEVGTAVLLSQQWPGSFCHSKFSRCVPRSQHAHCAEAGLCDCHALFPLQAFTMFSFLHSMDLHGYFAPLTKASKVQQTQAMVPQSQTNSTKAANHTISFSTAKRGNTRGMQPCQTFVDSCLLYDCSSVCNDLMLQDSLIVTPWISSEASDCSDID